MTGAAGALYGVAGFLAMVLFGLAVVGWLRILDRITDRWGVTVASFAAILVPFAIGVGIVGAIIGAQS